MALAPYFVFFFLSHQLLLSFSAEHDPNPRCPAFRCGHLGYIGFPFSNRTHPKCGLFIVDNCTQPQGPTIQLVKNEPFFYVRDISPDNMLKLSEQVYEPNDKRRTCTSCINMTLPRSSVISFDTPHKSNLFKCPHSSDKTTSNIRYLCNSTDYFIFYYNNDSSVPSSPPIGCSVIQRPVTKTQKRVEFVNLYAGIFHINVNVSRECYECHWRGGQCESDVKGRFHCSNAKTGTARGLITKASVAISACLIVLSIIALVLCFWKKLSFVDVMFFWKKKTKNHQNIEAFLRNCGSFAPKRYSYSEIKKMTKLFKLKLGQGGYGGVYKGKLLDGQNVAVKVLKDLEGNGEEFINEVATISRTSHVNIVHLFGYCFEGHRRALIYEFVPSGSLEKFIYEEKPVDRQLRWEKLYQIALGIARGLEYLHRGCSTRILHLDMKPHNILLDEDFCPKISDFGLAKICPKKESIISMTGVRGTAGYIAPEIFCRHFGEVSHKSDVYSYGMIILEMIRGKKNLDVVVGQTSEIYFPHWIFERLELDEELGLQGIENEEDNICARKMIIVSLWCIQTNPSNRPAIDRVVEMLEGRLDSLQFPPKPFLSSPTSVQANSTSSSF